MPFFPVPTLDSLNGFYSKYFTVPKKDGGFRPILDLTHLNSFISPCKFRMLTLDSIIPLLSQGDWFIIIDLQDAYFHISIPVSYTHLTLPTKA